MQYVTANLLYIFVNLICFWLLRITLQLSCIPPPRTSRSFFEPILVQGRRDRYDLFQSPFEFIGKNAINVTFIVAATENFSVSFYEKYHGATSCVFSAVFLSLFNLYDMYNTWIIKRICRRGCAVRCYCINKLRRRFCIYDTMIPLSVYVAFRLVINRQIPITSLYIELTSFVLIYYFFLHYLYTKQLPLSRFSL